jgi:DNA-binding transcriptional LysR family regulator
LAIFQAVAEAGSFSRGAEQLCISQPAVSQQVAEFERAMKTRLFDRLPKGARLTQSGVLLLGYARRLSVLESEAEQALAELHGLERGQLTVGASLTIGAYVLPLVFGRFRRQYPGIELALEIANTEAIQTMVLSGAVDLGLTEGLVESSELEANVFQSDELVAIAPVGHFLLGELPVTAARLCREPLIMREPGSGTRAVVERAFHERGLTLSPVMSLGSIEAIKRAVAAGVGLAIVSRLTLDLELETGHLALVPISDLTIRRPLHRLHRRGSYETRAAAAFLRLLKTNEDT